MWGNSIGRRVARTIKRRVEIAQKEHEEVCKKLDNACEQAKARAELEREQSKEKHALDLVDRIIGKQA